jgi:hypothetical protein
VPVGIKLIFSSLAVLLLPFVVYALRPGQTRTDDARWWRGGAADPMRRLLFREDGLPRRYSWAIAVGWFALWLTVLWLIPSSEA